MDRLNWGNYPPKEVFKDADPEICIFTVPKKMSPMLLASVKVAWKADLMDLCHEVLRKAKQNTETLAMGERLGDPFYVLKVRASNTEHTIIGVSPKLDGRWAAATGKIKDVGDGDPLLNNAFFGQGDADDRWNAFLTLGLNIVNPDNPTHRDVDDSTTTITIYRGMSLDVADDPTSGRPDTKQVGSSWTTKVEIAWAIAERGQAGFQTDNLGSKTHRVKPEGPKNRPFGQEGTQTVPTVIRAEVKLGEDASLYAGGVGGYKYLTSEQEVDVPSGTEITITGWMQADEIPTDPAAKRRAEDLAKADLTWKSKKGPEAEAYWTKRFSDEGSKESWYDVTYRWPSRWHEVKLRKKAAPQEREWSAQVRKVARQNRALWYHGAESEVREKMPPPKRDKASLEALFVKVLEAHHIPHDTDDPQGHRVA